MLLSDAVMLGSVSVKLQAGDWNNCGLGAAATAVGVPCMQHGRWPWLAKNFNLMNLARMFDDRVSHGDLSLEEFVAHIRSIEPPCGECCDFDCVCVRAEILRADIEESCGHESFTGRAVVS